MSVKQKIRILQGIRQGKVGGGESYLLSLVENLDRDNFEPVVLSFTDGPMVDRLRSSGISTHVIPTEKPFDVRVWGKVEKLIGREKIDIVHAHGTRANSNMFWAARQRRLPIIYTCHAWSFHVDQHPVIKKIRIWSEDFLTSRASVNICGSQANRDTARQLFRNFDAAIIHNSVDAQKFNPYKEYRDVRPELGIDENDLVIASIARFTLQKQPLRLIEAFSLIARQVPHAKLLMVGEGELKEKAMVLIDALGLQGRVILQPFRTDVPELLAATDIFVLPSLWEAFPIALLEAMSMGAAVIGTNVDGTPEMVEHGENGLLIGSGKDMEQELSEALLTLCTDHALRQELRQSAINSIYNKYNVETLARKNEEIYRQLLNK